MSFRDNKYRKQTQLSKHVWDLKDKGINYTMEWEIVRRSSTHMRVSGICNLCLEEKFAILCGKQAHQNDVLNKRSEYVSKCRHSNKPPNRAKKKQQGI